MSAMQPAPSPDTPPQKRPRNDPNRRLAKMIGEVTRRCHARSKATGKECGREAVPGATVCRYHGGAAPQVQRKAALRLLELVDPAIGTLAREMATADKSADRQRAANSILDRAGIARRVETPDSGVARAMLVERLLALRDVPPVQPLSEAQIVPSGLLHSDEDQSAVEAGS